MNKFYLTTAIPYTNAKPHIGFALEAIQTDVIARYKRLLGNHVFFLTGTDEHGTKVYQTARDQRSDPQRFVNNNAKAFLALRETLNLSFDDFIRTSDKKRHWPAAQTLWLKAKTKGDIIKKNYQGLYCVGCEQFKTRKELAGGLCIIHKTRPEVVREENYFFNLFRYKKQIKEKIESNELKIIPETRKNEVLSQIEESEDFSISRNKTRLPWGIPVPNDNSQTMYVWFDALVNYLSGVGYQTDQKKFETFWPCDLHVIGKDVLRFHAIYWPAMLLSADLSLPKTIFVHGFLTVDGQKISKSLGNVISPEEVVKKYSIDALRYFLLSQVPPTEDGDFSWEKLHDAYNGNLANGLGNLVSRIGALCEKSELEFASPKIKTSQAQLFRKNKIGKFLDDFEFNEALRFIWGKIGETDKKINKEKPWELLERKSGKRKVGRILQELIDDVREIASYLGPFLPETSVSIQKQFQGPKIAQVKPLFPRFRGT